MNQFIAVFDVGKTNKKMMIFDGALRLVDSDSARFRESRGMEGAEGENIYFEPIKEITDWFLSRLKMFSKRYNIGCVSVTTHGGTFVCVDKEGTITVPVVSYTSEPGKDFHEKFYSRFGDPGTLQKETATAPIGGLVNQAKNIYYLKETFPEAFTKAVRILNYPQYFGYLLTGKGAVEPTCLGCHTFLIEPRSMQWSSVTKGLAISDMFPETISPATGTLGTVTREAAQKTGLSTQTVVTMGIHDSNSSLLPHLVKNSGKFVLNSTGTWCVMMHPAGEISFRKDEIGKMIFYNIDVFSRPVKTSILMGGLEFETWSTLIKNASGETLLPQFDLALYRKVLAESNLFITPGVQRGTGQFPDSVPRVFENGRVYHLEEIRNGKVPRFFRDLPTASAVLNLSLAVQSMVALRRAGMGNGMDLFIEGGFSKNRDYTATLAALFPDSRTAVTSLEEATAFGAALLGKAVLEGKSPRDYAGLFEIEKAIAEPVELGSLGEYAARWLEII